MLPFLASLLARLGDGQCTLLMVGMAMLAVANLALLCLISIKLKQVCHQSRLSAAGLPAIVVFA